MKKLTLLLTLGLAMRLQAMDTGVDLGLDWDDILMGADISFPALAPEKTPLAQEEPPLDLFSLSMPTDGEPFSNELNDDWLDSLRPQLNDPQSPDLTPSTFQESRPEIHGTKHPNEDSEDSVNPLAKSARMGLLVQETSPETEYVCNRSCHGFKTNDPVLADLHEKVEAGPGKNVRCPAGCGNKNERVPMFKHILRHASKTDRTSTEPTALQNDTMPFAHEKLQKFLANLY